MAEPYVPDIFDGIEIPRTPSKRISELTVEELENWRTYFRKMEKRASQYPDLVVVKCNPKYGVVCIFEENDRSYFEGQKFRHTWSSISFYIARVGENNKEFAVGREILGLKPGDGLIADHLNGHPTDNRRSNLDITDTEGNNQNRRKPKGKFRSNYHGVWPNFKSGRFAAMLSIRKQRVCLGTFDTEIQAAEARDVRVVQEGLRNELNFPHKRPEYEKHKLLVFPDDVRKKVGASKCYPRGYQTLINIDGKQRSVFRSLSKEACWKYYDKYIVENNMTTRKLNYPEDYPEFKTVTNLRNVLKIEHLDDDTIRILHPKVKEGILVDTDVYERIKGFTISTSGKYPVVVINHVSIPIHKFVMGKNPEGKNEVDHLNHIPSDARRVNLRFTDRAENQRNMGPRYNKGPDGYTAVIQELSGSWRSSLKYGHITVFFERYKNPRNAALARDLFILSDPKYSFSPLYFDWDDCSAEERLSMRKKLDTKELGMRARSRGIQFLKTEETKQWQMAVLINGSVKSKRFETKLQAQKAREILIRTTPGYLRTEGKRGLRPLFDVTEEELEEWKKELDYEGFAYHFRCPGVEYEPSSSKINPWKMKVKFGDKHKTKYFETRVHAEMAREIFIASVPRGKKHLFPDEPYFGATEEELEEWMLEINYCGYDEHFDD